MLPRSTDSEALEAGPIHLGFNSPPGDPEAPSLRTGALGCFYRYFQCGRHSLDQWPPTFLATGTGFMEDSFSTDQVRGMVLE